MAADEKVSDLVLSQLEQSLAALVGQFVAEPHRFFTEADAVASFTSQVLQRPALAGIHRTADGQATGLLHREYPTFFRFKKSDPRRRLERPARRGHYDLALLDPNYVERHGATAVTNRRIEDRGILSPPPLLAVVEFKLFADAWDRRRVSDVRHVLGKLQLTLNPPAHARAVYLCLMQRDIQSTPRRWDANWGGVREMLAQAGDVASVVAVTWPEQQRDPLLEYRGPWVVDMP